MNVGAQSRYPLIHGSAEGEALCRECEGVPRLLLFLAGRRPVQRVMSGCQALEHATGTLDGQLPGWHRETNYSQVVGPLSVTFVHLTSVELIALTPMLSQQVEIDTACQG